jgi:hypothetical protein
MICTIDDNPLHFQQAILLNLEPSNDVKRLQMFNDRYFMLECFMHQYFTSALR